MLGFPPAFSGRATEKVGVLQLGELQVRWVSDGRFMLDGGAMFGPVPKPLWSKKVPSDERNRIWLGLNCMLVTGPGLGLVLIEAGLGNKLGPKQLEIYNAQREPDLVGALAAAGHRPEEVTDLILSHCDFDHLGGATFRDAEGRIRPTFPHAKVHVHATEWADLTAPNDRAKGTYLAENWQALAEAGLVRTFDHDGEILPGISAFHTGGHTRGHVVIQLESQGQGAVYMGDLMPSHHHLNPLWVMAYDNFPLSSIEARTAWMQRIAEANWWLLLYHDVEWAATRLAGPGALGAEHLPLALA